MDGTTKDNKYEPVLNDDSKTMIQNHINNMKKQESAGIIQTATTITDSNGKFEFYGLNPKKNYVVKFTYNGMRYEGLKASVTTGTTLSSEEQKKSFAIENETERALLTERFKEIGTYPYNYPSPSKPQWNTAYTQIEIENFIKTSGKNYGKIILELSGKSGDKLSSIEAFIKDTQIEATISLEGILDEAENKIKEENKSVYEGTKDTIYPVVKLEAVSGDEWYKPGIDEVALHYNQTGQTEKIKAYKTVYDAQARYEAMADKDPTIVGYEIQKHIFFDHYVYTISDDHDADHPTSSDLVNSHVLAQRVVFYKDKKYTIDIIYLTAGGSMHSCGEVVNPGPPPVSCPAQCGAVWSRAQQVEYYTINIFRISDAYNTEEENNILLAKFGAGEPYFSSNSKYPGAYDDYLNENPGSEGFPPLTLSVVSTAYGWGAKKEWTKDKICQRLLEAIENENRTQKVGFSNLGVLYRPTVDLGLYNDVLKADITINSKSETVKYDKRAADGGKFKFGVNEYDISGGSSDPRAAYVNYYTALSSGTITENSTNIGGSDYTYWMRNEDVENAFGSELSPTETGKAPAGGYSPYEVDVLLTYKIRLINQAETEATVTEIVDYYSEDFTVTGVYSDANKNNKISYTTTSTYNSRGPKRTVSGYKTVYIPVNKMLRNNEDMYVYVELKMNDAKGTLRGKLDAGYTTFNYAEINGYKTNIGVIDVDSMPGNIAYPKDGVDRFPNGAYEDDESKSPAMIFKNPNGEGRTIKGTVFEDETGMPEIVPGATRDGDGIFNGDKPVVGAIVQLVEYGEGDSMKTSTTDGGTGVRAQTLTDSSGNYEFNKIVAGDYKVQFVYGYNDQTVLTTINGGANDKSYNGQDYENTSYHNNAGNKYWYATDAGTRYSDAVDVKSRRNDVIAYSTTLNNHIAEVFNSYKDRAPNMTLVNELKDKTWMNALTETMALEVEDYRKYAERVVETKPDGTYEFDYVINNTDFGIVERERAEVQITKKVSHISLVDSSGKVITEGKYGDSIKYVKWIPGEDGFLDMEIDTELLSGATLKVTYEITVANTSESGNDISKIEVVDYVSNNLNFDQKANSEWKPITTTDLAKYVNNTCLSSSDPENKIDVDDYQTILITTFSGPGTKTLVLEKNLSSDEESNFNYENQVEIVSSYNRNGRGDYSSIYGNLDPTTYTSRQGDLKWDHINTINENQAVHGYAQMRTATTEDLSAYTTPNDAIRLAEKDSGNAEEVIITPPTGATGIVLQPIHYILALIALTTLAATTVLIKKYIAIEQE